MTIVSPAPLTLLVSARARHCRRARAMTAEAQAPTCKGREVTILGTDEAETCAAPTSAT